MKQDLNVWECNMKRYQETSESIEVSASESVRTIRELLKLSQYDLSVITGIPQSIISEIEHGRVNLEVGRVRALARALKCHPAVLVFSAWNIHDKKAA